LGSSLVSFEFLYWVKHVLIPIFATALAACASASVVKFLMPPSFVRIVLTTIVAELVFIPFVWWVVLEKPEKEFLVARILSRFKRRRAA